MEKTHDVADCDIVKMYDIDPEVNDEAKVIDGKCNEKAFQEAYGS